MTTAIIIASVIVGLCLIGAALIISSGVAGAAASMKESAPQALQQPTLKFFTEFDAADYLGVSLNELDYLRSEGLLDGSFMAVTSLEQTGEEEYTDIVDGIQVVKVRPVMANVTRFLFNRELLDEKVCNIIRDGRHINPLKSRAKNAPKASNKPNKDVKPEQKPEPVAEPSAEIADNADSAQDDIKEYIPQNGKGGNKNNYKNNNNNYGGKNNNGGKNSNGSGNKNNNGGQQKQNRPEQSANEPAAAVEPSADRQSDFPVAKQRIVPKPTITVISSRSDGEDNDGMVDIMSSAKPKN